MLRPETYSVSPLPQFGETHTYNTVDAFEADWTPIKRPFVPALDLPDPAYGRDSYTVVILPEDGTPQLYREGETAVFDDNIGPVAQADQGSSQVEASASRSTTDQEQEMTDDELELNPDEDGVDVFVDRFVVSDDGGSVPKKELYQAYLLWAERHDLDYTNDVWFGRKLSNCIDVGSDRQRNGGERVTLHTEIGLTEKGTRLLEEANSSE